MDATLWTATARLPDDPPLDADVRCDVCVVGAGIAGLSTAYRLAAAGLDVVVLDSEGVGSGESHHTSAHLASAFDDRIFKVEERFGAEVAIRVVESHAAAIDWIQETCGTESITCAFRRVPGYLFLAPGDDAEVIDKEQDAARRAGLRVSRRERAPWPGFDTGPCLEFADQAEFHPVRFLAGLAEAFRRHGGRLYGHTHVVNVEDAEPCRVETARGPTVTARTVLLATNSPANRYVVTMKMLPVRTFLVAMRCTGELPRALYWDTGDPYHYVRLGEDDAGPLVLVGGEDHQTGTKDEGDERFQRLEEWARERLPVGETAYRWSGQVLEPADWLAFIGPARRGGNVHVCTGDSGQGLTHGVICALLVGDLMRGLEHPWAEMYAPSRLTLKATGDYLADALAMGRHYLDWLLPGEVGSEEMVPRGHGAIVRDGSKLLAVYRDPDGRVQKHSAVCTHAGCIVRWDSTAKIWACPCHGSRFHPDGSVINGPATAALGDVRAAAD